MSKYIRPLFLMGNLCPHDISKKERMNCCPDCLANEFEAAELRGAEKMREKVKKLPCKCQDGSHFDSYKTCGRCEILEVLDPKKVLEGK